MIRMEIALILILAFVAGFLLSIRFQFASSSHEQSIRYTATLT